MKLRLNCMLVALWYWLKSRARISIWVRRSTHFKGLIPHVGTVTRERGRWYVLRDYVPPKRRLCTRDNVVCLFSGRHRIAILRIEAVKTFESAKEADAFLRTWRARSSPPQSAGGSTAEQEAPHETP